MDVLWGIAGGLVIIGIALLFSTNRRAINWRTITGALAIQVIFAFAVLKWDFGQMVLGKLSSGIQQLIDSSKAGIQFLFGSLVGGDGVIFAFQVLTVIIFFASLISVLYYLGVMQLVIKFIGGFLSRLLGTSKPESMSAAANVFVGQIEAPLVIKPYISKLTQSELFAVMTGGMASVAGSVLAGYALLGVPLEYLIAASFMNAPAGLLMAKLIMPETKKRETDEEFKMEKDEESQNVLDAAARGASDGMQLALNIAAILLAFISFIALINIILGWFAGWFGYGDLTIQTILGWIFSPIAFIIGVPWDEAIRAGSYFGQKLVLNEFVAYSSFAPHIADLSKKTVVIVSFALCGFANFGTIASLLGGLGGMAPNRRSDIAKFGLRALLAATLANLLNAAIAGMLMFY